ncbi:hypothetical protein I4F81_008415 [Pyropia yezoensis]|uniref:Uncharacterized protein n=1 Tax=Pyropia yezoensis TaxID=2788 RepID=A0ACC3C6U8_PYRYE|nr:hypothetical protein I4F81_008415 [Neopyropia yezoensis]
MAAAAALARAYGYPYPRPEASFVFAAGRAWPLLGAPSLAELRRPLPAVRLGAPLDAAAGGTADPGGGSDAGADALRDAATPSTTDGGLLGDLFPLRAPSRPSDDDAPPANATEAATDAPHGGWVAHEPWHSRVAILGIGSNGAPVQLARKFGRTALLPVLLSLPDVEGQGGVTLDSPCLAYVHRGGALTRGVGEGGNHLLVAEMLRAGGRAAAEEGDALNQRQVQRLVASLVAAAAALRHGAPAAPEAAASAAATAVAAMAARSPVDAATDAALDTWVLGNLAGAAGRASTLDAVRAAAVPRVLIPGHVAVEDAAAAAAVAVWAPRR